MGGWRRGRLALLLAVLAVPAASAASSATGAEGAAAAPRLVRVAGGLREPVLAVPVPGRPGRLLAVERAGRVRIVEGGRIGTRPFLDLRRRVRSDGFRGLLSLAFHPRFAANRRLFVNYVARDGDLLVDELRERDGLAVPSSRRTVLRIHVAQPNANHYGGLLQFASDGALLLSVGDGDEPSRAQDPDGQLGKLLRIDVDGPAARPTVVALGLRNPWRFSIDGPTGDLYVGDAGDSSREEVTRIPADVRGAVNLGWNVYEGTLLRRPDAAGLASTMLPPLVEYRSRPGRCQSVVGGLVYRGRDVPSLRGRYVYGDFCGGVWSLRVAGGRAVGRRAEPLTPWREQLVSFGLDARGELLLVTLAGSIYRVAGG